MTTAASRQQRVQGTIDITDRLVDLASRQGVLLDAYAWAPDPSREKCPGDYYHLTISAGPRHCEAKFSRAVLEDHAPGVNAEVRAVLEKMVRAVKA